MTDERRTKTIKFDMSDPDDKQLWEWLQTLPHGTFSEQVKAYWMEKMKEEKN